MSLDNHVETLISSVWDLIELSVPPTIVANHVSLVLQGWAEVASREPDADRIAFRQTCIHLANRLLAERENLTMETSGKSHGSAEVHLARAKALDAAREATLAIAVRSDL